MRKKFNDTGPCIPEQHFMADISAKLAQIVALVEEGAYFTINRPRQYGKTTSIHGLFLALNEKTDYLSIKLSFEGIGDAVFENEAVFCQSFVDDLAYRLRNSHPDHATFLQKEMKSVGSFRRLSRTISDFVQFSGKKIVVIIDEIDKASNNQLFLSFLGMLRDKYIDAKSRLDTTFHSVILAGVHDIKTIKLKIDPESVGKFNSPWNIAIDFKVEMSFEPQEIEAMLTAYAQDRGVAMNTAKIAKQLYYFTSGYPYLVSKICKFVDEDVLHQKETNKWEQADTEQAFRMITYGGYTTTLFDSITKYLEDDSDLFDMIFDITINGASYDFNINAPVVNTAAIYGIIRDDHGMCRIHNRVFEQRLYGYFLAKQATEKGQIETAEDPGFFSGGRFNLRLVLSKFQEFMKENYAQRDEKFLEREGRLLFLSFLKPILNGKGFDFKEPVTGDERRMDIVITYLNRRYVVELKRWRGAQYHEQGLQQLSDYLDSYSLREGFLLIFDFRKEKEYKTEDILVDGKEIFVVWI